MGAKAVTYEQISKDLETINKKLSEINRKLNKREVDFQKIAGDVFSNRGYSYTLSPEGDFKILADPGFTISGKWTGKVWRITLQVDMGENHVKSRTYEDIDLEISPAGFEHYLPLFDYLIDSLKKLSEKYNKSTKANKSSQLLESLVSSLQEELQFKAKIEPNSRSGGLLKMSRQLSGNLSLSTTLDFENYEKRCKEMAEAEKLIPPIVEDEFMKSIFYKTSRWKVNSGDLIEVKPSAFLNDDNVKMVYDSVDPSFQSTLESVDEESYDPDVINCLKNYGFIYYVRKETLVILLNSKFWLLIEKNKLYHFEFYTSEGYYKLQKGVAYYHVNNSNPPQNITKELLLKLLRYLSVASMANNGAESDYKKFIGYDPWWYSRKGALPVLFNPLLEYCLPQGYFYINQSSLDTRVFTDLEAKEGFLWKSDTPDWIEILINVIEHYGEIISLPITWNDAHLKDIKVTR